MQSGQFSPASDKPKFRRLRYILSGFLLIVIVVAAYAWYWNSTLEPVFIPDTAGQAPVSYGLLEGTGSVSGTPYGVLYYTLPTVVDATESTPPQSYEYDFVSDSSVMVDYRPLRDFNALNAKEGLALGATDSRFNSQTWLPYYLYRTSEELIQLAHVDGHWFNDLKVSPDASHYVYAYTKESQPSPDLNAVIDWYLAIHSLSDGKVITLEGAADPEWINGGQDLLFIADDGIKLYNLASGVTKTLFTEYLPYRYPDDLAVSPDSKSVLLTVSDLNGVSMISCFKFENNTLTEVARLTEDTASVKRWSPVFSPDSRFYAVVAAHLEPESEDTTTSTVSHVIEIRALDGTEPFQTINLDTSATLSLDSWSANSN